MSIDLCSNKAKLITRVILALGLVLGLGGLAIGYQSFQINRGISINAPSISWNGSQLLNNDKPYSGRIYGYHRNGNLSLEENYINGEREGSQTYYHLNGRRIEKFNYHAGKKTGLQFGWYGEGPRHFETYYTNGILNGKAIEWHQNGKVFREQTFNDGVEVGQKIFYQNGTTYSNYITMNQRIYGEKSSPLCSETKKDGEK